MPESSCDEYDGGYADKERRRIDARRCRHLEAIFGPPDF